MIVGLIGYDSIRKHLAACGYYTAEIREKYYLRIADAYIDIKEQRGQYWLENIMKDRFAVSMFGQKRLSREGGIEIVVKELCTRMARDGCQVTCYNRSGHHVSGVKYWGYFAKVHSWTNITEKVKVVDKEAYSYEEPVYETKGRAICNDCGADITDLGEEELTEHICNHALNGGKGSYRVDDVKMQTGTKTVTVPEKSHYENKVIGRKCSGCDKVEYY